MYNQQQNSFILHIPASLPVIFNFLISFSQFVAAKRYYFIGFLNFSASMSISNSLLSIWPTIFSRRSIAWE